MFKLNFIISYLFTGISLLILAILVLLKRPRTFLTRIFGIYSLSISWWSLFSVFMITAGNEAAATFWDKVCLAGTVFIPSTFIHFNYTFLKINKKHATTIKLLYGFSCFYLISLFTPFFIRGTEYKSVGVYFSEPSILYVSFIAYFFAASFYGIFCLFRRKNELEKGSYVHRQVSFLFWSTLVGYLGGGLNYNLVFDIPPLGIIPLGNYAIGIYVLLVAYAIIKHRLLDVEIIIKKTLVFAGMFAVSYAVFASFAYLGTMFFEDLGVGRLAGMVPSVFLVVLIMRPLEKFMREATDKYLFQKTYDYRELLRTFSDEVLTVLDLSDLVRLTAKKLTDIMRLVDVKIFLYDEDKKVYSLAGTGKEGGRAHSDISEKDPLVRHFSAKGEYILITQSGKGVHVPEEISRRMGELGSSLLIPFVHNGKLTGMLFLGKKKSDNDFTRDDIDILLPLARSLTIAIANGRLFNALSRSQAQAAQREKMAVIGTLSAGINHEICNPLGIARGQCEMFLLNLKEGIYADRSPEELLEKAGEIMNKVIRETDRATVITRKLSAFAKPARGDVADDVNVADEIAEVVSLVEHELKLENIELKQNIKEDLPAIAADRKQVQEIFFNLIRNAAQSISGEGEVNIKAYSSKNKVCIDISDTGCGISREDLTRIFDPFFTTKEPGKGTGLGLFIVKQVVERNHGHIAVQSEPGNGTTFYLVFSTAFSEEPEKGGNEESSRTENKYV